ncbi:MAG: hypothetical protein DLM73_09680 [Chthoniobacterales bacterium]|nr:MAG: hypothetical protein DLM73_09680 [Chthoniobacterales bacterium]
MNTDSGTVVTTLLISGDVDEIFYDEERHRLYAICSAGSIDIIDQIDKDDYKMNEKVVTAPGARTGFFVPELSSLFVAVPRRGSQGAEVRRFTVN